MSKVEAFFALLLLLNLINGLTSAASRFEIRVKLNAIQEQIQCGIEDMGQDNG